MIIGNKTSYIVTSTAPRALESAEILAEHLSPINPLELESMLWSGGESPEESWYKQNNHHNLLNNFVSAREHIVECLFIVGHLEFTDVLPSMYIMYELGLDSDYVERVTKGSAVRIDFDTKTHQYLSAVQK